jgi:hypothetical protein
VHKRVFSVFFFSLAAAIPAFAVDYPAELYGKWGTSPGYCPGLEIDKKYSV